jgi:hypothetical protein
MPSNTVHLYRIEIHKREGRNTELHTLNDFADGQDLLDWLRTKLTSWVLQAAGNVEALEAQAEEQAEAGHLDDEEAQRLLLVEDGTIEREGRRAGAILLNGRYGVVKQIIDRQGNRVGTLGRNHSALEPLYMTSYIPTDAVEGFMCFQKFGTGGVFTLTKKHLCHAFRQEFEGYTLHIDPVVDRELIVEMIEQGGLKILTLLKRNRNPTLQRRDGEQLEILASDDYYTRCEIVATRNHWLPIKRSVISFVRGDDGLNGLIPFENYDYDAVEAKVKVGRKFRKLRLDRGEGVSAAYDASDEVRIDTNTGRTNLADLRQFCNEILNEALQRAGIDPG